MSGELWFELLRNHKLVFLLCGTVIAIIAIIASQMRRAHCAKLDAELKRDMVARGRSAEEIERILQAKSESNQITWEAGLMNTQHSRAGKG